MFAWCFVWWRSWTEQLKSGHLEWNLLYHLQNNLFFLSWFGLIWFGLVRWIAWFCWESCNFNKSSRNFLFILGFEMSNSFCTMFDLWILDSITLFSLLSLGAHENWCCLLKWFSSKWHVFVATVWTFVVHLATGNEQLEKKLDKSAIKRLMRKRKSRRARLD